MSVTFHASCLCGEVRWRSTGPLRSPMPEGHPLAALFMSHCHCGRCRKAHGAPYATYLVVPERKLRITHGRERIARWESSPGMFRPFCGGCGSVVPDGVPWSGFVSTPVGPFDEDPGVTPHRAHLHRLQRPLARDHRHPPPLRHLPRGPGRAGHGDPSPGRSPRRGPARELPLRRRRLLPRRAAHPLSHLPLLPLPEGPPSAAHVSYMMMPLSGLHFTRGEDLLITYEVPEAQHFKHAFCRVCGSSMPRADATRSVGIVPMGSLDDDPGVRPTVHIYAGSRMRGT